MMGRLLSKSNGIKQRDSIDIYRQIAHNHKGELLSKEYKTAREKLKFKCFKGHVFERVAYDVKKKNKWCHECAKNGFDVNKD
jgi:hypothetical protein